MTACTNDDDIKEDENDNKPKTEFKVNLDPTDYSIASLVSIDGDFIFIFGEKTNSGMPKSMREVIITPHDGDGTTEIALNKEGNPTKVTAPNGVIMLFDWIAENKAALTLVDPNSNEQLNTLLDFNRENAECGNETPEKARQATKRIGKGELTLKPFSQKSNINPTPASRAGSKRGQLTVRQCNVATNAECWVNAYSYSGMPHSGVGNFVGRLKCVNVGQGKYEYILPQGVTGEHHDLAEHCDLVMSVLTGICQVSNTLGPAYKNAICTQISAGIAAGGISVPVALGFEAACVALNYSLEIFCHTTAMEGAMYGDAFSGADALCGVLQEMHLEWDDPLLLIPTVNALPSNVSGIPEQWDGTGELPSLEVSWGGDANISQFTLTPSAPGRGQSYVATAYLYCLPAGSIITLSIVGTDGYTNSNIFVVGDEINYQAELWVPGAESGVKDVCTIKLELPDGSVKTKKASLVFQ